MDVLYGTCRENVCRALFSSLSEKCVHIKDICICIYIYVVMYTSYVQMYMIYVICIKIYTIIGI